MDTKKWYKCDKCGYTERRLLPNYIKTSDTPCPKCNGKMKRIE